MCLDFEQAELKDLKQSDRAGADDHSIGLDRLRSRAVAAISDSFSDFIAWEAATETHQN